ncbi:hypothetical protein [Streptomyces pseudovenezuelae]|uniref:hypothetical protein n=1 Tax=Streptomyces pseudovenezuelae TaxID=67350 RepID=UPI0036EB8756
MDAPDFSTLDDEQYSDLLSGQVHPKFRNPDVWAALTSTENIERTRAVLVDMHQRTAATLHRKKTERDAFEQECRARGAAGKQAWFQSRPAYEDSRRKTALFHQKVQQAISEVTKAQKANNRATSHLVSNAARETLRQLAIAVQRHQATHAKTGTIAGQEDYELWQLLDRLTVPCGPNQEPTTLRTMLDFYWTDVEVRTAGEQERAAAEKAMRQAPAGRSGQFTGVPRARHVGNQKDLSA